MPIKRIPPTLILKHGGVSIYETYENNDYEKPRRFVFSTSNDERTNVHMFDVRKLPTSKDYNVEVPEEIVMCIIDSIDKGIIRETHFSSSKIH